MSLEHLALTKANDLPIKHQEEVHNGNVRSAYWLTNEDSARLIEKNNYPIAADSQLGALLITDKLSAFECRWVAEEGLGGVPGKGAVLNAISKYWFDMFDETGLAPHHIVDVPHPLVWIVQRTKPVMIEAIVRAYITGSMWRDYKKGEREICGIPIPEGLKEHQKLASLLFTPSTKGIITGVPGIPEDDDVNITLDQIKKNYKAFNFAKPEDVDAYVALVMKSFPLISDRLASVGKIFVDTKYEIGYAKNRDGELRLIYQDEVGTPDSSRIWDAEKYEKGVVEEDSKEGFRQFLLTTLDRNILTDKKRMEERKALAAGYKVPVDEMMKVSETYKGIARTITGQDIPSIGNARGEILDVLSSPRYDLIK